MISYNVEGLHVPKNAIKYKKVYSTKNNEQSQMRSNGLTN